MIIRVKRIDDDEWNRPRLKNLDTGAIYADVSCGDAEDYPYAGKRWLGGVWYSTTAEGEPDCPIRDDVVFALVDPAKMGLTATRAMQAVVDLGGGRVVVTEVFGIRQSFATPQMPRNRWTGNAEIGSSLYLVETDDRKIWRRQGGGAS